MNFKILLHSSAEIIFSTRKIFDEKNFPHMGFSTKKFFHTWGFRRKKFSTKKIGVEKTLSIITVTTVTALAA